MAQIKKNSSVSATLANREKLYGNFTEVARVSQNIKEAMRDSNNWEQLNPEMKESLEMVANKLSRILTGNIEYADSWHDIAGYAQLVEATL